MINDACISNIIDSMKGNYTKGIHLMDSDFENEVFTSFHDLANLIHETKNKLKSNGVTEGEHILFPFETTITHIVTFFAIMTIKAIPLSITALSATENKKEYISYITRIKNKFNATKIFIPEDIGLNLPSDINLLKLDDIKSSEFLIESPHRTETLDDLAFVQFSSGSTSFPKGVPITHQKVWTHTNRVINFDKRTCDDNFASWLPLYHDMGLIGGLLSSLVKQNNLYLSPPKVFLFDPLGWLKLLSDKKIAIFPTPNFAIEYIIKLCPDLDEISHLDLSNLTSIYIGSEPINPTSLKQFTSLLANVGLNEKAIVACYGMAEAVLMVTGNHQTGFNTFTDSLGVEYASVGKPLEDIKIKINKTDFSDSHLPAGEILIKSNDLAQSYYGVEDLLTDKNGYYHSGDIGFVHENELYVIGRIGDRLKVNGKSLFAIDLERIIDDCAVFKKGNFAVVQVGKNIHAIGVPNTLKILNDSDQFKNKISDSISAIYNISIPVGHIHFVRKKSILKTSSGKLKRHNILDLLANNKLSNMSTITYQVDFMRYYLALLRLKLFS